MACVIPFPRRRKPRLNPDYSFLTEAVLRQHAAEGPRKAPPNAEEILELLRRIDRRLAKISVA